ncbi:MAG TPA: porin [Chitinophagaceae bacterium]|nr:porin [Chitinophagaceae bacterium]
MKRQLLGILLLMTGKFSGAQDSTIQKESFNWLLFADTYYCFDFNKPIGNERPSFIYNHKRHDEPNINLLLSKASWQGYNLRANLGLMAGNYSSYNLAAEPALLRHFFEANFGFRLSKKKDWWLDAGILPSHIGFESAISANNSTLTRSMAADNSPYYETGIKITHTTADKRLQFSGLLLNGWQRIKRAPGNKSISAGTQVTWMPNNKVTVNWSTFWGNDKPDTARQTRFFNNLYGIFSLHEKWNLILGFDIGWQDKPRQPGHDTWMTPVCVVQYKVSDKWSIAARGEYFSDKKYVIIHPAIPNSAFAVSGFSLNIDRRLGNTFVWRTEYRTLTSQEAVFVKNNHPVKTNTAITTAICFKFE